ncbi:MAG: 50S ribosomal protein L35 [bacterium]
MARKAKTCKTAAKRFRVTGTGKIMRGHVGHSHLLSKKSSARKRRLTTQVCVDKADFPRIRALLSKSGR